MTTQRFSVVPMRDMLVRGAATLVLVSAAQPALATDFTVTTREDVVAADGEVSLREAVMAATSNAPVEDAPAGEPDGDTISFSLGVDLEGFERVIELTQGPLEIGDDLTIDGTLAAEPLTSLTLSGGMASQVFAIDTAAAPGDSGAVAISGMLLTDGASTVSGGAIEIAAGSEVTLTDVDIQNSNAAGANNGEGGGAIFNAGTLTVTGGSIAGNAASGTSGSGGGILNSGTLTATGTSFSGNEAMRAGGAIEATEGSTTTLDGVTMDANSTGPNPGNGGGLHITGAGDATITGGSVTNNTAANEGGGLWNGAGSMSVTGTSITGNDAQGTGEARGGGGVFNNGGSVTLADVTVSGNFASGDGSSEMIASGSGGGVLNKGTLTVSGGSISGNDALRAGGGIEAVAGTSTTLEGGVQLIDNTTGPNPGNGGGLHITGAGDATITGGSITGNIAANEGGGLWNGAGTMTVSAAQVSGNSATGDQLGNGGGGLFNLAGTLNLTDVTVSGNSAPNGAASGGGILNRGAALNVTGGTISGNDASRAGGGIEDNPGEGVTSTVTLTEVTLSGNETGPNPGNGGAFHNTGAESTVQVRGSTANGNIAANEGGGFWNFGGAAMAITNSTISDNTANGTGGAGLFNQPNGEMTLTNATVAFNSTTGDGGGLLNSADGTVTATNTIFGGNGADGSGPQVSGAITASFSLLTSTDGATVTGENNQLDVMGGLQPLAANGGPTQTHAIDSTSPAFENGDGETCQMAPVDGVDQRGVLRKQPDCDIGAFESVDGPQALATSTLDDGEVTVSPGDSDVPLLGLQLENATDAEALQVSTLSGSLAATGDAETRFVNPRVVIDANANGSVDSGETVLSTDAGQVNLDIASGRFSVTFSPERLIAPGASEAYLVIVDVATEEVATSGFALFAAGGGGSLLAIGLVGGLRRRHAMILAALLATAGLSACGDSSGSDTTTLQASLTNVEASGAVSGDPAEGLMLPIEGPLLRVEE